MVKHNFFLTFYKSDGANVHFEISSSPGQIEFTYNRENCHFLFKKHNQLTELLVRNELQLAKIVTSALKGNPTPGQQIQCLFIENFTFLSNSDYNHFIRVDQRGGHPLISVSYEETKNIHKLFTDGSYASELNQCGYAGMVMNYISDPVIFYDKFSGGSSNLAELQAVLEGLKQLVDIEKIQINTDSRFVIRGLSQWIHFWRFNDWKMAYGRKVSFAEQWQQLDKLCQGKLLELKWVKGHSGDERQEFCHQLAKKTATELIG